MEIQRDRSTLHQQTILSTNMQIFQLKKKLYLLETTENKKNKKKGKNVKEEISDPPLSQNGIVKHIY